MNISDGETAGEIGEPIIGIAIKASSGRVSYRVHTVGGSWLPYVTGYDFNDSKNGYAGNNKPIDCIEVRHNLITTKYRVSSLDSNFYPYQLASQTNNNMEGYAGKIGKAIDRFQLTQNR